MEIKTKFNLKDKVWILNSCKATEIEICSISISPATADERPRITYLGTYGDSKVATTSEQECFISKQELIKHVAGDE